MEEKIRDLKAQYHRLLSPRVVALIVTLRLDLLPNVMVATWHTPVSANPPVLAVCISQNRLTHKLIQNHNQFTVNIPDSSLIEKIDYAGYNSGSNIDKSKLFNYTHAMMVKPPVIAESIGVIECKVNRMLEVGDHSIIFGDVLTAYAKGFGEVWIANSPLLHLGSNFYTEMKTMEPKKKK